jgi:L-ribulose-5-phosphate 3-epimerase
MQGRLSSMIDGKIQAFPWSSWREEFLAARVLQIPLMEWTLDQERLYENPLMTVDGRRAIKDLCRHHCISIPSLTGDCFMQAPFWKVDGEVRASLQRDFLEITYACINAGIRMIVVPLVDNGSVDTDEQESLLVNFLLAHQSLFANENMRVIFEMDRPPEDVVRFIDLLPVDQFGINYDIGNSAALGFNPIDEFAAYGGRIMNVHIKDRVLGGPTVPLQTGNADFFSVFSGLSKIDYQGKFILQTARAVDGNHAEVLGHYRDLTCQWIGRHYVTVHK